MGNWSRRRLMGVPLTLGLLNPVVAGPSLALGRMADPEPAAPPKPAPATAVPPHPLAIGRPPRDTGAPLPEQMRDLNFLLGRWKCVATSAHPQGPDDPVTGYLMWMDTRRIFGGHYVESTIKVTPLPAGASNGLSGRWVFGWNPVDSQFISFYYEDFDGSGTATSPGWEDGRITFTGNYFAYGNRVTSRDSFEVVDEGHFVDHTSYLDDGVWQPLSTIQCHRY